jgi:hypothetical protein
LKKRRDNARVGDPVELARRRRWNAANRDRLHQYYERHEIRLRVALQIVRELGIEL